MSGRVVNVRSGEPYDVYIGRRNRRHGLTRSRWANPFAIPRDGDRDTVSGRYRAWLLGQPELLAQLPDLRGKVLACWCAPLACHDDVLLELAERGG